MPWEKHVKEAEVKLVDPHKLVRNPDNPRLIFREDEMLVLQESIEKQGILVPVTVYPSGSRYRLLDGERRWLSALKLGMPRIPAIVQAKPERLTNIMMMFAIHHARKDWDPLPTALKLEDLEKEFERRHRKKPTEKELAGLASMSRGEVRRLKKLLNLPQSDREALLKELEKPRPEQVLTVDQVLEAANAAVALRKRAIVDKKGEDQVRRALIQKFRTGVINNTVAPRKLAKIARAVERNELTMEAARRVVDNIVARPAYSVDDAFRDSVEQLDFEHNLTTLTDRIARLIETHRERQFRPSISTRKSLEDLASLIRQFLRQN